MRKGSSKGSGGLLEGFWHVVPRAAAGVWGRLRREDAWDAAVFGRDDDVFAHVLTFWRSDRDVWG